MLKYHLILILLIPSLWSCAASGIRTNDTKYKKLSQGGNYTVRLFPPLGGIPLRKIHQWRVEVLDRQGHALQDAEIHVYGGMPAHQHDFPTKPRLTRDLGQGLYEVDGIKFTMLGLWQIRFTIIQPDKRDFVSFDINI